MAYWLYKGSLAKPSPTLIYLPSNNSIHGLHFNARLPFIISNSCLSCKYIVGFHIVSLPVVADREVLHETMYCIVE